MKALKIIACVLVLIGGLNWGLVGLFDFDLVQTLFGEMPMLARLIYVLIGLSAVFEIARWKCLKKCVNMK